MLLVLVGDKNGSCVVLQPSGTNESCFLVAKDDTVPANRLYGAATSRPILQPCLRFVLCISIVADDSASCAHAPADG